MPPITRLDHVIVAVRNLDEAATAWRRLGFTLTPRGLHEGEFCVACGRVPQTLVFVIVQFSITTKIVLAFRGRSPLRGHGGGNRRANATRQLRARCRRHAACTAHERTTRLRRLTADAMSTWAITEPLGQGLLWRSAMAKAFA